MTDERLDYWIAYIVHLRDLLKLSEWRVFLSNALPDGPDAHAQIECTYGRRSATIRVCHDWEQSTPEDQRNAITHELLHCYFTPIQSVMNRAGEVFGDQASIVSAYHLEQMEYAIDGIATAIAPLLPLPEAA